jgi:serine/threonine protein kinase
MGNHPVDLPPELTDIMSTTDVVFSESTFSADENYEGILPATVGPYHIIRPLGRGGMGDVFLAFDKALSREVAVKRIRPDRIGEEEMRRRFEMEAQVTGILQHPSIVPVYQYWGGRPGGLLLRAYPRGSRRKSDPDFPHVLSGSGESHAFAS